MQLPLRRLVEALAAAVAAAVAGVAVVAVVAAVAAVAVEPLISTGFSLRVILSRRDVRYVWPDSPRLKTYR